MACNSNFPKSQRKKTAKYLRYQMLEAQVRYYKWCYYELDSHMMDDRNYDRLEKQFNALAFELDLPGSWVDSRDQLVSVVDVNIRPESLTQIVEFRPVGVDDA